ncbi:3-isopropylmalate dehydratase small subunit [Hoeflea prorocentri]|uniref:3-isopropylmalate dehydratase small subunit n=1 Tax=Hoeflea prorocentri TaxID=1922333 RepID=A0A9X3UQV5_9HYPH|nr:3-isopropylmalate dehydratase small subunit [Hoeflea prorocentri]MCY6383704.1 3-isopropylmalate dehydratase small subunit [Hoeflea prorocentri]MDA5401504.1 3-isopropylmalate dehydratase small subunit [Hoeflea prorocentri]
MEKLTTLTSLAAPLLESNIDTDVIFPARFLLMLEREGIGQYAFHERRKHPDTPFILDTPPFDNARILVVGANFGTGSSREHAVWALADLGIRYVIAPSFGEIFHANCFKNGVLPITLEDPHMTALEAAASAMEPITIDLPEQTIRLQSGTEIEFHVDTHRKQALVGGLDEIGMILAEDRDVIDAFEASRSDEEPWLTLDEQHLAYLETKQRQKK